MNNGGLKREKDQRAQTGHHNPIEMFSGHHKEVMDGRTEKRKKKGGHFECSPNYSVLKSGWKIHMTDFCTSQLCIVLGMKPVIIDAQMHFAQFRNEPKAIFCLCFSHKDLYIL